MDIDRFLPGIIGSFVGVVGWLLVGVYIQRRGGIRQAKSAGRAVYFELDMNRLGIAVARDHGSFVPLSRSSFERLLPELAAWLSVSDLQTIVAAYLGHAGYAQASSDPALPTAGRRMILDALLVAHVRAIDVLGPRVFTAREVKALGAERPRPGVPAATQTGR